MPLKKNIRCGICGKIIRTTKDVPFDVRMAKLRRHYKKYHPRAFRLMYIRAARTRRERAKYKGIAVGLWGTLAKFLGTKIAVGLIKYAYDTNKEKLREFVDLYTEKQMRRLQAEHPRLYAIIRAIREGYYEAA